MRGRIASGCMFACGDTITRFGIDWAYKPWLRDKNAAERARSATYQASEAMLRQATIASMKREHVQASLTPEEYAKRKADRRTLLDAREQARRDYWETKRRREDERMRQDEEWDRATEGQWHQPILYELWGWYDGKYRVHFSRVGVDCAPFQRVKGKWILDHLT